MRQRVRRIRQEGMAQYNVSEGAGATGPRARNQQRRGPLLGNERSRCGWPEARRSGKRRPATTLHLLPDVTKPFLEQRSDMVIVERVVRDLAVLAVADEPHLP